MLSRPTYVLNNLLLLFFLENAPAFAPTARGVSSAAAFLHQSLSVGHRRDTSTIITTTIIIIIIIMSPGKYSSMDEDMQNLRNLIPGLNKGDNVSQVKI